MKLTDFIRGIKYALSGFKIIFQPKVKRYVAIPLLINIVLFSLAIYFSSNFIGVWVDKLTGWLPSWLDWLQYIVWALFGSMMLIATFFTFTAIANLISAPFNSMLAAQVEQNLTGNQVADTSLFTGLGSTLLSESRKIFYWLRWLVLLTIISFIPIVNVVAPVLWFLFSAWFITLQYSDYAMANHQLFIKDELQVMRKNRALTLGFGATLSVMMLIPILNFLVIPVGVAGGAKLWVERFSKR